MVRSLTHQPMISKNGTARKRDEKRDTRRDGEEVMPRSGPSFLAVSDVVGLVGDGFTEEASVFLVSSECLFGSFP